MAIIVKTNPTLTKVAAAVDDTRKLIDRKLDEVSEKIETARREIRYLALEEGEIEERLSSCQHELEQLREQEVECMLSVDDDFNQANILELLRNNYDYDFCDTSQWPESNIKRNENGTITYAITEDFFKDAHFVMCQACGKLCRVANFDEMFSPDDEELIKLRSRIVDIENRMENDTLKAASLHHTSTEMKKLHHDLLEERGQWNESETSAEIVARNADTLMKVLNVFIDQPGSPLDNPTLMKQVERFTENMETLQETLVDLGYDKYLGDQLPAEVKMQPEALVESAVTYTVYRGSHLIFWTTTFILPSVLLYLRTLYIIRKSFPE